MIIFTWLIMVMMMEGGVACVGDHLEMVAVITFVMMVVVVVMT